MPDPEALLAGLRRQQPPFDPPPLEDVARRAGRARRRRHRRVAIVAALAVVVTAAGVAGGLAAQPGSGGGGSVRVVGPAGAPGAGGAGLTGELAVVVRGGTLELLASGRRHVVAGAGVASQPAWSPDGKWVAFLETPAPPKSNPYATESSRLWVAKADGTDFHAVSPATLDVEQFAWSPKADRLAVSGATGTSGELVVVSPTSSGVQTLHVGGQPSSFAWSPSGRQLAVGETTPVRGAPTLGTLVLVGFGGARSGVVTTSRGNGFEVAGWWPDGKGVIYWQDEGFSASIAADGLPLDSVDLATGRRVTLAESALTYANWLAWSPSGTTLAVVAGGNRSIWDGGKHLELCTFPAASCVGVPQPAGRMDLDPTWTASGELVFTQAPGTTSEDMGPPPGISGVSGWGNQAVSAWYAASELWTADAAGGDLHPLAGAPGGGHDAQATPAGLFYVRDGDLWYLASGGTRAIQVAGPLASPSAYGPYYGYVPWYEDFA